MTTDPRSSLYSYRLYASRVLGHHWLSPQDSPKQVCRKLFLAAQLLDIIPSLAWLIFLSAFGQVLGTTTTTTTLSSSSSSSSLTATKSLSVINSQSNADQGWSQTLLLIGVFLSFGVVNSAVFFYSHRGTSIISNPSSSSSSLRSSSNHSRNNNSTNRNHRSNQQHQQHARRRSSTPGARRGSTIAGGALSSPSSHNHHHHHHHHHHHPSSSSLSSSSSSSLEDHDQRSPPISDSMFETAVLCQGLIGFCLAWMTGSDLGVNILTLRLAGLGMIAAFGRARYLGSLGFVFGAVLISSLGFFGDYPVLSRQIQKHLWPYIVSHSLAMFFVHALLIRDVWTFLRLPNSHLNQQRKILEGLLHHTADSLQHQRFFTIAAQEEEDLAARHFFHQQQKENGEHNNDNNNNNSSNNNQMGSLNNNLLDPVKLAKNASVAQKSVNDFYLQLPKLDDVALRYSLTVLRNHFVVATSLLHAAQCSSAFGANSFHFPTSEDDEFSSVNNNTHNNSRMASIADSPLHKSHTAPPSPITGQVHTSSQQQQHQQEAGNNNQNENNNTLSGKKSSTVTITSPTQQSLAASMRSPSYTSLSASMRHGSNANRRVGCVLVLAASPSSSSAASTSSSEGAREASEMEEIVFFVAKQNGGFVHQGSSALRMVVSWNIILNSTVEIASNNNSGVLSKRNYESACAQCVLTLHHRCRGFFHGVAVKGAALSPCSKTVSFLSDSWLDAHMHAELIRCASETNSILIDFPTSMSASKFFQLDFLDLYSRDLASSLISILSQQQQRERERQQQEEEGEQQEEESLLFKANPKRICPLFSVVREEVQQQQTSLLLSASSDGEKGGSREEEGESLLPSNLLAARALTDGNWNELAALLSSEEAALIDASEDVLAVLEEFVALHCTTAALVVADDADGDNNNNNNNNDTADENAAAVIAILGAAHASSGEYSNKTGEEGEEGNKVEGEVLVVEEKKEEGEEQREKQEVAAEKEEEKVVVEKKEN